MCHVDSCIAATSRANRSPHHHAQVTMPGPNNFRTQTALRCQYQGGAGLGQDASGDQAGHGSVKGRSLRAIQLGNAAGTADRGGATRARARASWARCRGLPPQLPGRTSSSRGGRARWPTELAKYQRQPRGRKDELGLAQVDRSGGHVEEL